LFSPASSEIGIELHWTLGSTWSHDFVPKRRKYASRNNHIDAVTLDRQYFLQRLLKPCRTKNGQVSGNLFTSKDAKLKFRVRLHTQLQTSALSNNWV
jgi:hypothetical protein